MRLPPGTVGAFVNDVQRVLLWSIDHDEDTLDLVLRAIPLDSGAAVDALNEVVDLTLWATSDRPFSEVAEVRSAAIRLARAAGVAVDGRSP